MDVLWKGLLGGLVTAVIALASKRGDVLPGILPLVPTLAIIALVAVGSKGDMGGFKTACLASAKTIPAYLTFLATAYLLVDYIDYRLAIAGGFMAWLVVAALIFISPRLI